MGVRCTRTSGHETEASALSQEIILTNARVVLPDAVVEGTVVIRDGRIADVQTGRSGSASAQDLAGDHLLPGLVEIHTDNLERHLQPRPSVYWPSPRAAVLAHDAQIASAGITTVLDAIAVGDYREGGQRRRMLLDAVAAITDTREQDLFRADHLVHLRCEISDEGVVTLFEEMAGNPLVRLASLMDHTPGQRQWSDMKTYRNFHRTKNWTEEEFQTHIREKQAAHDRVAEPNRRRILDLARTHGMALASHDDTTPDHVDEAHGDGLTISEFPTTEAAARRARAVGMTVVMGAPNVVRGGSHSGNVSAGELAQAGLLDALSSDYVPASLLHAAFILSHKGLDLPGAIATVTRNPAAMVGLEDRGAIVPGLRADLVRVRVVGDLPVVRAVWSHGVEVA
jgi:alpha-D-ribose 1-methylphosphonate 5-triphosphate diphosphatase